MKYRLKPPATLAVTVFKKGKYFLIDPVNDEELTKPQMSMLLKECFKMPPVEIAIMYSDFEEHPHNTRGFFEIGALTGKWRFLWTE